MFAAEYASRVSYAVARTVHVEVCTHAGLKNSSSSSPICLFACLSKAYRLHEGGNVTLEHRALY